MAPRCRRCHPPKPRVRRVLDVGRVVVGPGGVPELRPATGFTAEALEAAVRLALRRAEATRPPK